MTTKKWQPALPADTVYRCYRCNELLNKERLVWLELNCKTGEWAKSGEAPWTDGPDSQGSFEFGAACARRVLKTQTTD